MYYVTVEIKLPDLFYYKKTYFMNLAEIKEFMSKPRPHYVLVSIDFDIPLTASEVLEELSTALQIASEQFNKHLDKCSTHYKLLD